MKISRNSNLLESSYDLFTDVDARTKYAMLQERYSAGHPVTAAMAYADAADVRSLRTGGYYPIPGVPYVKYPSTPHNDELGKLQEALERIGSIAAVAETVHGLTATAKPDPANPGGLHPAEILGADQIAGLRLDHPKTLRNRVSTHLGGMRSKAVLCETRRSWSSIAANAGRHCVRSGSTHSTR